MSRSNRTYALAVLLALPMAASADDLEGRVETVDSEAKTFTVQGITFQTSPDTDYDDGLKRFEDLQQDQSVEVDFRYRDGQHHATEVELEN